jgi:hypothetical protein
MAHRQRPFGVLVLRRMADLRCSRLRARHQLHAAFQENHHARPQLHVHVGRTHSRFHLERVNQGVFACAEKPRTGISGPRRRRTGPFYFLFVPTAPGGTPEKKDTGVMWQYFSSDLAFDLVKGLVVGGASLAFQAVAPTMLRALREVRARYAARKAAREQSGAVSPALQAAASAMLRAVRKVRARWAARKAARKQ